MNFPLKFLTFICTKISLIVSTDLFYISGYNDAEITLIHNLTFEQ